MDVSIEPNASCPRPARGRSRLQVARDKNNDGERRPLKDHDRSQKPSLICETYRRQRRRYAALGKTRALKEAAEQFVSVSPDSEIRACIPADDNNKGVRGNNCAP